MSDPAQAMNDWPDHTVSSENVFADLGLPDPDTQKAKPELALRISTAISNRGLTQREAAAVLGIDQSRVSAITRGRLTYFSLERLLTLVNRLGMDVEIVVRQSGTPDQPWRTQIRVE